MEKYKINKNTIIGLVILVIIGIIFLGLYTLKTKNVSTYTQVVSEYEPIDILLDFYDPWLEALRSSTTDPYTLKLAEDPLLSQHLRERLLRASPEAELDPVLCQEIVPNKISSRRIQEQDDQVQILVLSKDPVQPGQATVTLLRLNEGWYIDDITCSQGESDSSLNDGFEKKGVLVKDAPPPYDPNIWHLGFTEDALRVKIVPLFFSPDSICVDVNGTELACDTNNFIETDMVTIQGNMTEAGVDVVRLEHIK